MKNEAKKALLLEKIDFGSGVIKDYEIFRTSGIQEEYQDGMSVDHVSNGFHVEYSGGLAVNVYWWKNDRPSHCSIVKDDTQIASYYSASLDDKFLRLIQHCVNEVESGKYRNKKSIQEMVAEIVERRGLTSYMNNTKWQEFRVAMEDEMPFGPPYIYKTLFEEEKGEYFNFSDDIIVSGTFTDFYDIESFAGWNYKIIEWVKVRPRYYEYDGGRWAGKKIMHDAESKFLEILNKYSIPYEVENGTYIIYGYK